MDDDQGKFVAAEPLFDDLPMGWTRIALGQVAEINPSGKTVSPSDDTLVSFLPMAAVEELSGRIDARTERPFAEVKKGFTRFRDGDLLFAKITPSMENGKIAVARNLKNGMGCGTTEFHVLRPSEGIDVEYLRYFVVRDCFRGEAQRQMSGAVGQQRVPTQFLALYPLPLPPLAEQRRIVSRIDELFSRIEAGERAIIAARKGLKGYRKSILKAAVTGALTADWRDERGDPEETGEALRNRIVGARLPKDSSRRSVPSELHDLDELEPAELPDTWSTAALGELFQVATGSTPSRKESTYWNGGIPWVSSGEVAFKPITSTRETISEAGLGNALTRLHPAGTVLLAMIGEGKTRGQCAILRIPAANNQNCAAIRVSETPIPPEFIYSCLEQRYLKSRSQSQGGNQPALNGAIVSGIRVPLPPLDEQAEIISRAEEAFSRADHAETTLSAQERNARALKQSILKAAFEGRLVPQNSNDEPAADMLARIASETFAHKIKTKAGT